MRHRAFFTRASAAVVVICALLVVGPARAHEGHDQTASTPTATDPNRIVRSASDGKYEIVLKYNATARPELIHATLYVSDFATNAPIRQARVAFHTTTPAQIEAVATQSRPGIYALDLPATKSADYTAIISVTAATSSEFALQNVPLGKAPAVAAAETKPKGERGAPTVWPWVLGLLLVAAVIVLIVRRGRARKQYRVGAAVLLVAAGGLALHGQSQGHAGHDQAPGAAVAGAGPREVSKESQFLLNVRTVVARVEELREQITAVGHVVPGPGALATVAAPQSGRFERVGRPLAIGDRVGKGQLLGYLLVIDRLPVRSPISGLVSDVRVTSGQWVQAGEALAQVLNESQMRIEVPLFGENLTKALASRAATVRLSALPGRTFPARMLGLAPTSSAPEQASEGSQQPMASPITPVLLEVTNTGGLLRPGMLVEVGIESSVGHPGVAVPQSAVVYQESGPGVFVHTAPEVFEYRPVGISGRHPGRVEISGDIKPGDRVVTEGAYTLISAAPVSAGAGVKP